LALEKDVPNPSARQSDCVSSSFFLITFKFILLCVSLSALLVNYFYEMSPLNHKRTTSSLAPPIFYAAKMTIKRLQSPKIKIDVLSPDKAKNNISC